MLAITATKALILLFCLFIVDNSLAEPAELELQVGHTRLLPAPGVTRVAIGDGDIAEVKIIEATSEILLIGRKAGTTDLRTWQDDGSQYRRIRVLPPEKKPSESSTSRATVLPKPTIQVQARFVELRRSALRQIGINWSTQSPGITFAYASDFYTNDIFRGGFGEFLPADALPLDIGGGNQYLGLGVNLTSMIDLLGESGEARIIAEPMLSTLSGSTAEFQAGGEVPIPIQGEDGNASVMFKDYGILLNVAPEMGEDNLIRTNIEVEVSDIDESVSVMGVPGFSVRNATTEMNAKSGETLLIAGLIDEQQSKAVSQIPGLGDLPIIGELFKSRRFQQDQTELVVLITPTSHQTATPPHETPTPETIGQHLPPAAGLSHTALPLKEGWE